MEYASNINKFCIQQIHNMSSPLARAWSDTLRYSITNFHQYCIFRAKIPLQANLPDEALEDIEEVLINDPKDFPVICLKVKY